MTSRSPTTRYLKVILRHRAFGPQATKSLEKIALTLISVLAWSVIMRADGTVRSNNPYAPISDRNIFGLRPRSSVIPATATETKETPFKIYCSGLTSILGRWQVLFSVRSGQPERSYIMTEGEQRDDIKVIRIDPSACVIVFDNHGVVQQIHLAEKPKPDAPGKFQTPSQILFQMEHPNGD